MKRFGLTMLAACLPAAAQACAVCGANGKSQSNFLIPTIFLSLLPLALVFGALLWLRHHAGEAARGEWTEREPVVPPHPDVSVVQAPVTSAAVALKEA